MEHILFCTGHELKRPDIAKSDGLYLYDGQGKRFMDLESGVWCASLGHNNAFLTGSSAKHAQIKISVTYHVKCFKKYQIMYLSLFLNQAALLVLYGFLQRH